MHLTVVVCMIVCVCQVSATTGVWSDGRMYSVQVFLGTLQNATDVSSQLNSDQFLCS